jgi:acetylornithine deacetylase/succinyl-diaminopimelate desuccinylase-like protein
MTNTASSSASPTESWLTFLLVVLLIFVAIRDLVSPSALSASAPQTDFSAQRALAHLKIIAVRPHPVGSDENQRVRDYIVEQLKTMGLAPQMQRGSAVGPFVQWGPPYFAGSAENVMVLLPETDPTGTVLWTAHYDSVPTAPGATDNGSGVVVLLETLRALRAGLPLRNTMIFLFTDGEETQGIGAEAFAREHPWAKAVTLGDES